MDVRATQDSAEQIEADALVVGVFDKGELTPAAEQVDAVGDRVITRLVELGEIAGTENETTTLFGVEGVAANQVLVVGLGSRNQADAGAAYRAAGAALKRLASKPRETVALMLAAGTQSADAWTQSAVAGAITGCQGQDLYRRKKSLTPVATLLAGGAAEAVAAGQILGESINFTRRLVNMPAEDMYPESFVEAVRAAVVPHGVAVDAWDRAKLEAERCGSLLAVARGSSREPRLAIMRYEGADQDAPTLALVGKGVTFDSGGLSIKPSEGMKTMKCDMAGAATVAGALAAIARLKLPINVTGYCGLVENMTGPAAYKLGDVLTTRQGTTIEVLNTDAEGRLVLADVLDVARTDGADKIIDLATLTGACVVALGLEVAGLMTNDEPWCEVVEKSAEAVGERVWQLPMFSDYDELIKSEVADIRNTGQGRWGGAITAAKLLQRFVGDVPWTHIDIAGPAFRDSPKPWCDAGASGALVRTLVEVARRWQR